MRTIFTALILGAIAACLAVVPGCSAPPAEVQVTDLKTGTGDAAKRHMRATVHYTGWTADGAEFDSSRGRGQPFSFVIDAGAVIPGWDQGIKGMRVGGVRALRIPPHLAYGERGVPPRIPPNATLKFEIELLALEGPGYANVSNAALKELIARGVPLIDIRRADEWEQTGVVEGAVLRTAFDKQGKLVPGFLETLRQRIPPQGEVALICRTGNRTSVIAQILSDRMGYTRVHNVEHGITKWIQDGNPVVRP